MFSRLDYFETLIYNSLMSTERVLIGVLFASLIGVLLGMLRSRLPYAIKTNLFFKLCIELPKYPPPIAWIPFVILIAGVGNLAAWLIVFIGAFPPIFTNAYEAINHIHPNIIRTADSLEIKGLRRLWLIILPSTLPQFLVGIRIGAGMGWMSVIAAEMVSGQSGLGYSIQLNRLNLQYDLMAYDMIAIGFIGFIIHEGLKLLEKKLVPWHLAIYNERSKK